MDTPAMEIGELLRALDAGEPVTVLDVRNEQDFASWRIESRRPFALLNVPYFAFLEEPEAALARVPRASALVVVCAKGGSSALVVELLAAAGLSASNVEGGMAAYGEHLEPAAIPDTPRFALWQVNRRGKGCLSYVACAGGEALVVDPSRDVAWTERFVARQGARIVRVLDTHVHADHLSGGPALAARAGAPYAVGLDARAGALRPPAEPLADGQRLRFGGADGGALELEVIATPGHTPGSASFLLAGRWLFSGDTLFVRGVGRPDLGGEAEAWGRALFRSLRGRLARLPDETVVLPAHSAGADEIGSDGTVRATLRELRRAPELALESEDEFVRAVAHGAEPAPEAYAELVRANLGLSRPEPERIVEWELGKNRCATAAEP